MYKASGPGCPATCLDPKAEDTCTLEPQEGCFCKAGYLLSDGACVPKTQCGCQTKNGDYYPVTLLSKTKTHLNYTLAVHKRNTIRNVIQIIMFKLALNFSK